MHLKKYLATSAAQSAFEEWLKANFKQEAKTAKAAADIPAESLAIAEESK